MSRFDSASRTGTLCLRVGDGLSKSRVFAGEMMASTVFLVYLGPKRPDILTEFTVEGLLGR